jgi:hypothetical protein
MTDPDPSVPSTSSSPSEQMSPTLTPAQVERIAAFVHQVLHE